MNKFSNLSLLTALTMATSMDTLAVPTGFTSEVSFLSALDGIAVSTLDFDDMNDMDIISSGSVINGLAFDYDYGGYEMMVINAESVGFDTTSAPNYLGTNDGAVFQDGDNFTISFSQPVNAFGLNIMTSDTLFDGDIKLIANGSAIEISASAIEETLSDGSNAYFLGFIDTQNISSVTFDTIGGGYFFYTIDDIRTATVPIPSAIWLFTLGITGLAFSACKRR